MDGSISIYSGDTLWALAAFLGTGLVLPRASSRTIALQAMSFSVAVELSQLYHGPWIDSIRQITLGGLILGFGFVWSDPACYPVGVGLGIMIDIGAKALKERQHRTSTEPAHGIEFEMDVRGSYEQDSRSSD
jgi:hypothetical protein